MQNFHFEYTKTVVLIGLTFTCLAIGLAIAFILPELGYVLGLDMNGIVGISSGAVLLYLNRDQFKKTGEASLSDNVLELDLDGIKRDIAFETIQSYKVDYGNGTVLYLRFHDQPEISITVNNIFCNAELFYDFCIQFEKELTIYGKTGKTAIERKPSVFESKWVLILLSAATVLFFGLILIASYKGHRVERQLLSGFAGLGTIWFAWFLAWIKKKRLEQ